MGTEGWKIRLLRTALNLSQPTLAKMVNIHASYISAIEMGHVAPTNALMQRLRRALRWTERVDALLDELAAEMKMAETKE